MYLNSETPGKWHSAEDTYIETIIQGKISMFYDNVISVAHSVSLALTEHVTVPVLL